MRGLVSRAASDCCAAQLTRRPHRVPLFVFVLALVLGASAQAEDQALRASITARAQSSIAQSTAELARYPSGDYNIRLRARIARLEALNVCLANAAATLADCRATFDGSRAQFLKVVQAQKLRSDDVRRRRNACEDSDNPSQCLPAITQELAALKTEREAALQAAAGLASTTASETTTTTTTTTTTATTTAATTYATTAAPFDPLAPFTTTVAGQTTPAPLSPEVVALKAQLKDLRARLAACDYSDDDTCAAAVRAQIASVHAQLLAAGHVAKRGCKRQNKKFLRLLSALSNAVNATSLEQTASANTALRAHRQRALKRVHRKQRACLRLTRVRARRACGKTARMLARHLRIKKRVQRRVNRCARETDAAARHGCLERALLSARRRLRTSCRALTCRRSARRFVRLLSTLSDSIINATDATVVSASTAAVQANIDVHTAHVGARRQRCVLLSDAAAKQRCKRKLRASRRVLRIKKRALRRSVKCQFVQDATARRRCSRRALRRAARVLSRRCRGGRRACIKRARVFTRLMARAARRVRLGRYGRRYRNARRRINRHISAHSRRLHARSRRCRRLRSRRSRRRCHRQVKRSTRALHSKRALRRRLHGCRSKSDDGKRARCVARTMRRVASVFRGTCERRSRCRAAGRFLSLLHRLGRHIHAGNRPNAYRRVNRRIRRLFKSRRRALKARRQRCHAPTLSVRRRHQCVRHARRARRALVRHHRHYRALRKCRHHADVGARSECVATRLRLSRTRLSCRSRRNRRCRPLKHYMRLMGRLARSIRSRHAARVARRRRQLAHYLRRAGRRLHKQRRSRACRRNRRCRLRLNRLLQAHTRRVKHARRLHTCAAQTDDAAMTSCVTHRMQRAALAAQQCNNVRGSAATSSSPTDAVSAFRARRARRTRRQRHRLHRALRALSRCGPDVACRNAALARVNALRQAAHERRERHRLARQKLHEERVKLQTQLLACKDDACRTAVQAQIAVAQAAIDQQSPVSVAQASESTAVATLQESLSGCDALAAQNGTAASECRLAAFASYRDEINGRVLALNVQLREEARQQFVAAVTLCNASLDSGAFATVATTTATTTTTTTATTTAAATVVPGAATTTTVVPVATTTAAPTATATVVPVATAYAACVNNASNALVFRLTVLGGEDLAASAQEAVRRCASAADINACVAAVQAAAERDQAIMRDDAKSQAAAIRSQVAPGVPGAGAVLAVQACVVVATIVAALALL